MCQFLRGGGGGGGVGGGLGDVGTRHSSFGCKYVIVMTLRPRVWREGNIK